TPFVASSPSGVLAAIVADEPTPLCDVAPETPRALALVVHRCLVKARSDRPGSVVELAGLLTPFASAAGRAIAADLGAPAPPPAAADIAGTATLGASATTGATWHRPLAAGPRPGALRWAVVALIGLAGAVVFAQLARSTPRPAVARSGRVL